MVSWNDSASGGQADYPDNKVEQVDKSGYIALRAHLEFQGCKAISQCRSRRGRLSMNSSSFLLYGTSPPRRRSQATGCELRCHLGDGRPCSDRIRKRKHCRLWGAVSSSGTHNFVEMPPTTEGAMGRGQRQRGRDTVKRTAKVLCCNCDAGSVVNGWPEGRCNRIFLRTA